MCMEASRSPVSPVCRNAVPPYGHLIVHERWRGSALVGGFKGGVKAMFEEQLGPVDVQFSSAASLLYVSESDLVAGNGYKRKLVKFRNSKAGLQGIVVVEKTLLSSQYFPAVQKFVVFQLGLTLLPVSGQTEASRLITQLAHEMSKETRQNPFVRKSTLRLSDPLVLALMLKIPGVGRAKALTLVQSFPSIHQLSHASVQELRPIVGLTTAQNIRAFFTQS
ncbi:Fanconi anemia-associated protein of 24 kDa-like [Scleropages formosus]|uniref:FA core complex associated protein 24 n=1 Tax=Scleropages formosus TaxID=113540 RepID=A0A0P7UPM2_SCLFO|nr:Fanconi anemia core complex-associated protein 24 [Scleropages formosus]KPP71040.1 Fanconi anemia-associated protein of 24 kDa-like [Scleropages formosus]